jgi:hypothetical protein
MGQIRTYRISKAPSNRARDFRLDKGQALEIYDEEALILSQSRVGTN